MMNPIRRCAAAIAGACLLTSLVLLPTAAAAGPLDRYSPADLVRWLHDEIDDLYATMNPDREYAVDDLEELILAELGDNLEAVHASPRHVAAHRVLTRAALDAEMEEADTTLEDVVHAAVLEADRIASPRQPRLLALNGAGDSVRSDAAGSDPVLIAMENKSTTLREASNQTARFIAGAVQKKR